MCLCVCLCLLCVCVCVRVYIHDIRNGRQPAALRPRCLPSSSSAVAARASARWASSAPCTCGGGSSPRTTTSSWPRASRAASTLGRHGTDAFARTNADVFKRMLDAHRVKCVIECGMSSLADDAQAALRRYAATNPVVYVHREREQIRRFLDPGRGRPAAPPRRDPPAAAPTSSTTTSTTPTAASRRPPALLLVSPPAQWDSPSASPSKLLHAKEDFTRFLDLLLGQAWRRSWQESPFSIDALPPQLRAYSYALRLRLSYLVDMDLEWDDFEAQADCVELIVDHWPDDVFNLVARQVALIRRKLSVPVIYHVEENPRGERKRPPEERDRADAELLELGLRLNVDYISLDLQRSPALVEHVLARKGVSRIIGNFWHTGLAALPWGDDAHVQNYLRAQALGCDVVRMARFCVGNTPTERCWSSATPSTRPWPTPSRRSWPTTTRCWACARRCRAASSTPSSIPTCRPGRDHLAARVHLQPQLRAALTPVPARPAAVLHGRVQRVVLHHAGRPHGAYAFSGMPHTFQSLQCSSLDELTRACLSSTFGGAQLAAPFKVAILPLLKSQSHHATIIGAVNVILPLRGASSFILDHANARNKAGATAEFYGDNTDWISILNCLKRAISPRNYVQPSRNHGPRHRRRRHVPAPPSTPSSSWAAATSSSTTARPANARAVAAHFNDWARHHGLAGDAAAAAAAAAPPHPPRAHLPRPHLHRPAWPERLPPPTMVISCVPATSTDGNPPRRL